METAVTTAAIVARMVQVFGRLGVVAFAAFVFDRNP
jgi:hypothetical protein